MPEFSYQDAVNYISRFTNYERGRRYPYNDSSMNTLRVKELLYFLNNPHRRIKCIHIAGTKGKGSTATILASILKEAGYKVGLYTSPHIVDQRERIQVDGEIITEFSLSLLVEILKPYVERLYKNSKLGRITYFELMTVMAYTHFARTQVDFGIIEVGLGGRYDATNVINPLASIITRISLDHTDILGDSLKSIALEKSQIIKGGSLVICVPQDPEVMEVIIRRCEEAGARLISSEFGVRSSECGGQSAEFGVGAIHELPVQSSGINIHKIDKTGTEFSVRTNLREYKNLKISLLGRHQVSNAITALTAAEILTELGIDVPLSAIRSGLRSVKLPGRIQVINEHPCLVLDGAHNVESIKALRDTVNETFPARRAIIVIGIAGDKDIEGMVRELLDLADLFILPRTKALRLDTRKRIQAAIEGSGKKIIIKEDIPSAISSAKKEANRDDCIIVTGSFYMVGEAFEYLGLVPRFS